MTTKRERLEGLLTSVGATEDEIKHYGVPGMKWGKRKSEPSVPDGEVAVSQPKPGTKVQTQGGKKIPAHEDAIKTAVSKQKAKVSTTDALSTKDLQELVNRMNLEQQYQKLTTQQVSPGRKFVNDLIMKTVKEQATKALTNQLNTSLEDFAKKKSNTSVQ
jgi:hypothetical protein